MSPAKRELARHLLKNHSVRDVVALLNRSISGEAVTYSQVDSVRRGLVKTADLPTRDRITERPGPSLKPDAQPLDDPNRLVRRTADAVASQQLHTATIAMFARRGEALGCDFAMAGAMILNRPELLAA